MTVSPSSWSRHAWHGTAEDFHALDIVGKRSMWICNVVRPALIVGSSQSVEEIDVACAESHHIDIVRRRSGGGIVYVHPSDSLWIDITISRDDPLWVDDVSRSMLWLGDVFVDALSTWINATVHTGSFEAGPFGRDVCFASSAPGEVFVGDHKLVGISQRRTRDGARFQCVLYRRWAEVNWIECLTSPHARDGVRQLHVATVDISAGDIADAVFAALPA